VAAAFLVVGVLHLLVDGVVDGFNSVCVVDGELWVVWRLDIDVDDAVDYAKGVHLELNALDLAFLDGFILLIEVVIESGAVVTAIAETILATLISTTRSDYLSVHRLNVKFVISGSNCGDRSRKA
jgi:hypothetical protein